MLDGYSAPGDLVDTSGDSPKPGSQLSLSDIANGFLQSVAQSAAQGVGNVINNQTRTQNTAPVPDLSAAAAKPQVATFTNSSAFGVSLPILLLGAGAVVYLLVRK